MKKGSSLTNSLCLEEDEVPVSPKIETGDPFASPSHISGYVSGGLVDQRQRDEAISAAPYQFNHNFGDSPRYVPPGIATEPTSFRSSNSAADSHLTSISPTPLTSVSSSYDAFQTQYPVQVDYATSVVQSRPFMRTESLPLHRQPPLYEISPHRSTLASTGLEVRPPQHGIGYAIEREHYMLPPSYTGRPHIPSNAYHNHPEPPRVIVPNHPAVLTTPQGGTTHHRSNMPSTSTGQQGSQNDCSHFPFSEFQHIADVHVDGHLVEFDIHARMEKGFFQAEDEERNWTCYRRNYFSVSCSYTLSPFQHGGTMTVRREGGDKVVKAIGIRMSAVADGANGKVVELIQYTAKRDNGDKEPLRMAKVLPFRGDPTHNTHHAHPPQHMTMYHGPMQALPNLPFQNLEDGPPSVVSSSSRQQPAPSGQYIPNAYNGGATEPNDSVVFDRIQFKIATANNGKRRATQQFFHLLMEAFVDIRQTIDDEPEWIKVAQRVSGKIIVRGRSPSHYNDQRQSRNGPDRHNGGGGGSNYAPPMSNGPFATLSPNMAGFRPIAHPAHQMYEGGGYDGGYYQQGYHDTDMSGADDSPEDFTPSDDEQRGLHMPVRGQYSHEEYPAQSAYGYYQGPTVVHPPPDRQLPWIEPQPRGYSSEMRFPLHADYPDAKPGPDYQGLPGGRFQGMPSSHRFFPDLRDPSRDLLPGSGPPPNDEY